MKKPIVATALLLAAAAHAATYQDDFNRADGPLGANWTIAGGNYAITNGLVANNTTGNVVAFWNKGQTLNAGTNGFFLAATVTLDANVNTAWAGIVFNYQNPTNFYTLRFSGLGEVQLWRIVDGAISTFYNGAGIEFAHVQNRPYRLEASSVTPYVFRVSVRDTVTDQVVWLLSSATDGGSNFMDGHGGLYCASLAPVTYDDFELTPEVFQDDFNRANTAFNTDAGVSVGAGYVLSQLSGDRQAQARILSNRIQLNQTAGTVNANNIVLRYTGLELANAGSNESFRVEGDIVSANIISSSLLYGLAFNVQPDGSFYAVRINTGSATVLQLVRFNNTGAATAFHSATNAVFLSTNSTYHLTVESSDPGVIGYTLTGPGIDGGILAGTATDTVLKLADGLAGFYATAANVSIGFDNLFIKLSLPPEELAVGYAAWAGSWGVEIGATTNDYDGDGLLNLAEYAFGGDPTNGLDIGYVPVIAMNGSNLAYVHAARNDDTSLSYQLETTYDLVFGAWTNIGYAVAGTYAPGGSLNVVTNAIPPDEPQAFIRLRIQQE